MIQKTQSPGANQLKRTHHNSTPFDEQTDTQSIEQLISRIQSTILQTSESMKHQLQSFEEQQLISYKNDLLKTQQDFIKVRAQRNEDVLKNNILKEKAKVEEKFNTQKKKYMEMNTKYEQMKGLVKTLGEEDTELMMEINYIKRKIEIQKKEGLRLDEELNEMEQEKHQKLTKKVSKMDEERKLFTELVNKCENGNKQKKDTKEGQLTKINIVENYHKKMQKKLKYEISNLKDYIENIPLQLNFVENVLYQSIKERFAQAKSKVQEELKEDLQGQVDEEEVNGDKGEDKQNRKQNDIRDDPIKQTKPIKLPSIMNINILEVKGLKKNNQNKENSHQFKSPKQLKNNKPFQIKSKLVHKQIQVKQNQYIPNIEHLPKSSGLLEQIFSDPQVKQYLYKIMFNGMGQE